MECRLLLIHHRREVHRDYLSLRLHKILLVAQTLASITRPEQFTHMEPLLRDADMLLNQYMDLQFGTRMQPSKPGESREVREKRALESLEKISEQGPVRGGFADVLTYVSGLTKRK